MIMSHRFFRVSAAASVLGIAGLLLTGVFGFEEPNNTLLLLSFILIFAAPVSVLAHLGTTRGLTRQEKRIWIRALASTRIASAFSAYTTCPDRRALLERFEEGGEDSTPRGS